MPEIPLKPEDQELCRIHDYEYEQWDEGQKKQKHKKREKTVTKAVTEEKLQYPSVDDLQKIRDDAFNEGFKTGYKEGLAKGKIKGESEGVESGKKTGFESGQKEGMEKGEKEGFEKTKKEVEDAYLKIFKNQNKVWQSLITRLKSSLDEQDTKLKAAMTQMVVQICRGIFVAEMSLKPDHIQYIVKQVLDALPNDEQKLQVFVNSDDYAELENVMDYHPNQDMKYTIDNTLQSGGCYIKAKYSYVDFSLTSRFKHQLKDLIESVDGLDWDDIINLNKALPDTHIVEEDEIIENEVGTQEEVCENEAIINNAQSKQEEVNTKPENINSDQPEAESIEVSSESEGLDKKIEPESEAEKNNNLEKNESLDSVNKEEGNE